MPPRRAVALLALCAIPLAASGTGGPLPCAEAPCVVAPLPAGPIDPPAPAVTLRVRVAACSAQGQDLVYRICAENNSLAAAHHVVVRNPLPANARFVRAVPEPTALKPELRWELGTLAPGCRREIVLTLVPIDGADVKNCARVQFEHGQCVTTRIARAAPPVAVPEAPQGPPPMPPPDDPGRVKPEPVAVARLTLSMSGPTRQAVNQPATYRVTVSNVGSAAATRVLIDNAIPEGMEFVNAGEPAKVLAGRAAWFLGDLAPGASRTVEITLKAKQAGEICNRARALADGGLSAEAELCTRFGGVSALAVRVDVTRNPLPLDEETAYLVVVTNQGAVPVTNLKVNALVPPQLALVRASGASDPPPKEKLPPPGKDGQLLQFAPLPSLAPGAEARYEVSARATQAGDVRFQAELLADQLEAGPVTLQQATQVFDPAIKDGP